MTKKKISRDIIILFSVFLSIFSISYAMEGITYNCSNEPEIFVVAPFMEKCIVSPWGDKTPCLVINGSARAIDISGFNYKEGFEYKLKVKRCDMHIPLYIAYDGGFSRYDLISIISKEKGKTKTYYKILLSFDKIHRIFVINLDYIFSGLVFVGGVGYIMYKRRSRKNKLEPNTNT